MEHIDLRFADETAFNLVPNVPYGWMRKGEQKGIPSQKGGNLNLFGLLNLKGDMDISFNVTSFSVIKHYSFMSLRLSPIILKQKTDNIINNPGKVITHQ